MMLQDYRELTGMATYIHEWDWHIERFELVKWLDIILVYIRALLNIVLVVDGQGFTYYQKDHTNSTIVSFSTHALSSYVWLYLTGRRSLSLIGSIMTRSMPNARRDKIASTAMQPLRRNPLLRHWLVEIALRNFWGRQQLTEGQIFHENVGKIKSDGVIHSVSRHADDDHVYDMQLHWHEHCISRTIYDYMIWPVTGHGHRSIDCESVLVSFCKDEAFRVEYLATTDEHKSSSEGIYESIAFSTSRKPAFN